MAIFTEETVSAYLKSPLRYKWGREANNRRGGKIGYITDRKMENIGFSFLTYFQKLFTV